MLGILYAALGAFTFALNNVAMRRGVVTGSVLQGMAMTVPFGGLTFLVIASGGSRRFQRVVCGDDLALDLCEVPADLADH